MDCGEFSARLRAYLDGELAKEEHQEMDRHLEECEESRSLHEAYRRLTGLGAELRQRRTPPDLQTRLQDTLAAALAQPAEKETEESGPETKNGNQEKGPGI